MNLKKFVLLFFTLYGGNPCFSSPHRDTLTTNEYARDQTYNISLLLPFNTYKIDFNNLYDRKNFEAADLAIDYYLGTRLAFDSLSKLGLKIVLNVFDTKNDSNEVKRISRMPEVEKSDLIIGPVFPDELAGIAAFSKKKNILTVSPLSPAPLTHYKNPNFVVATAPIEEHGKRLALFVKQKLKPKKVIIIRSSDPNETRFVSSFRKNLDTLEKAILVQKAEYNPVKNGFDNLKLSLSLTDTNVLFVPTADPLVLTSLFTQLNALSSSYSFKLLGHPNWERLNKIDIQLFERFNSHITSSYHVNYDDSMTNKLIKTYRAVYHTDPSEYAIKAFDIAYYFGTLLLKDGRNMEKAMKNYSTQMNHTLFNFRKSESSGYQNHHLTVLRYINFQLVEQK